MTAATETTMRHGAARWPLLIGVALVAAITVAHYATPTHSHALHDTYRRMYYVPIVLVAVMWGMRAGLLIAGLTAIVYFPHIYTHWGGSPLGPENLNRTLEVVMWLVVGALTGFLADRERAAARAANSARAAAERALQEARRSAKTMLEMQERLRQADRLSALGLLAAQLAHEVRNPLASLRGINDMLRDDYPADHPRHELIDIMDAEIRRLDGVVQAFLDHARPRDDGGPAAVAETVVAVRQLLASEVERRGVRVCLDLPEGDFSVPVPEEPLRQVLINLIMNSLEAFDETGGEIRIRGVKNGRGHVLIVEDDGPGLPRELIEGDPGPFFTTREHGTGLGLAICRDIVVSHGGTFELSDRNHGVRGARITMRFTGA